MQRTCWSAVVRVIGGAILFLIAFSLWLVLRQSR